MSFSTEFLKQAELALASYAELSPGEPNQTNLQDSGRGMSIDQASRFSINWRVILQYDNINNGLSATIFADESGKKCLAIRGTQPQLNDLTSDGLLAVGLPAWLNPQFIALKAQIDLWREDPQFLGNQPFTVTGHSLGGYLAAAVKQHYGAQVSDAYLYNAPGVSGLLGNILSVFGLSGTSTSNIWNIKADASISPIAGLGAQVAPVIRVAIEDQTVGVPSPPAALNHSQQVLTDALSLLDTFAKLDASLSVLDFNALLASTSGQNHLTLESALDALRKLVIGVDGGATVAGNRDAFYGNVYALQDSAAYKNLAASGSAKITALGKLNVVQIADLASSSSSAGLAARYALQALNPFALVGIDYASLNVNGDLNLYNTDTAPSGMTPEYLADRSSLLARKLWFSTQDKSPVNPALVAGPDHSQFESDATYFKDYASGYQIAQGFAPDSPMSSIHRYLFGDGNANTLTGGGVEDSLYGGAGNETFNGQGGADYLEGNAGADTLDGGAGVDNDVLNGGADADLYIVGTGAGLDTLASSDAGDRLKLGTRTLDGSGTFVSSGNGMTVWRDGSVATDPITYSLNTASHELTVKGANSVVLVKDFASGDLGIVVPAAAALPPPPATSFDKDFSSIAQPSVFWPAASIETDAAQANHLVNFNNWNVGNYSDMVFINAKDNNDWIEGGAGANANLKLIKAGSGDDRVYASTTQTLADAVAAQELAVATGRSDLLLDGGFGNDSVFGAAGDDALFGGDGADTIAGGAGTDVIFSDGDSGLQDSELNQQSTAGFRWVAGSNAGGSWIYFNGLSFTASPGSSPNPPASNERTYTCAA
ncbi:MAG: hypothetical protein V9G29_05165 [Burkholderiaceae bacterium]